MKYSRIGEALWSEWDGAGYEHTLESAELAFYTYDHVSLETELVKRALASTLQRDGLVSSLGQAFKILDETSHTFHGYSGFIDGDIVSVFCDEKGYTELGEQVDEALPTTWVEVWLPWI